MITALLCVAGWPTRVRAQEPTPLVDLLSFLLTNQSVPTGDFVKDAEAALATRDTMTRLLQVELSTLPLSTSSAGFAYRLNPAIGTVERVSSSFGPFFTERSFTAGRGQASLGVAFTSLRFTHLDDRDLRDGQFVATGNQFRDEVEPFDIETLTLDLETRTTTFFGNLGLTDRLDVAVAVPLVSVRLSGERWNTYRGVSLRQAAADGEATGLGDVAVRTKLRLAGRQATGLAIVGEARLPTGRREDLLGAGAAAYRGLLVASAETGRIAVHANGGMATGGLADEQFYRGAVTLAASQRLTLIGEILGRRIDDVGRLALERSAHPSIAGVETLRLVREGANLHAVSAVAGAKWNVARTWVLSGQISWPVRAPGLRPRPAAFVGLDVAFGG